MNYAELGDKTEKVNERFWGLFLRLLSQIFETRDKKIKSKDCWLGRKMLFLRKW